MSFLIDSIKSIFNDMHIDCHDRANAFLKQAAIKIICAIGIYEQCRPFHTRIRFEFAASQPFIFIEYRRISKNAFTHFTVFMYEIIYNRHIMVIKYSHYLIWDICSIFIIICHNSPDSFQCHMMISIIEFINKISYDLIESFFWFHLSNLSNIFFDQIISKGLHQSKQNFVFDTIRKFIMGTT